MKKIAFAVFCLALAFGLNAQTKQGPLIRYLQENFDSTVIWHTWSAWDAEPHFRIISRKGNKSACFTYFNPYNSFPGRLYPKELGEKFLQLSMAYKSTVPDTNRYFLPFNVAYSKSDSLWSAILNNNCWVLNDDKTDGEGCKEKQCRIADAGISDFFLLTKDGVKQLHFYAPEYFDNCCPGREGRSKIIKVINAFLYVFNQYQNEGSYRKN